MQIIYNPTYRKHFNSIIESIPHFPYKFRKSFHYDNENIRDYIFKGYTIPYYVDMDKNQIIILDIFKWVDK